jgi:C-terminal processing protease CtpA/Prc
LRFDRREFETKGRLRITEVVDLGPAAIAGTIKAGDYLIAVDGRNIDRNYERRRVIELQDWTAHQSHRGVAG